jgi:trimethylamine--corrinoid protein Co-methyltransferase
MSSFEDLVIDNEICGMHLRAAQGVVVDDERLAVDEIADAMNGNDFFLQPHTLKHLRNGELFETQVGLYGPVQEWEDHGSKTISENAREKAKSILAAHEDEPLPAEVEREFERIIKSAKQNLL